MPGLALFVLVAGINGDTQSMNRHFVCQKKKQKTSLSVWQHIKAASLYGKVYLVMPVIYFYFTNTVRP